MMHRRSACDLAFVVPALLLIAGPTAHAQDAGGVHPDAQSEERTNGPLVGFAGELRVLSTIADNTGAAAAEVGWWFEGGSFEHVVMLEIGVGINRGSCDARFELGGRLAYELLWHYDWLIMGGQAAVGGFPQSRCVSNGMFWHISTTREYGSLAFLVGARAGILRMGAALRVGFVELDGGGFPPDDAGGSGPAASVGMFVHAFL